MFINKQDTFYGTPCSSSSTWISVSTSFSCHFWLTGLFFRNHSRLDRVPKGELETPAIHTIFHNSLCFNGHFFPNEPGSAGFTGAKDDGSGGDNWSYKMYRAPVITINKPTPNFLQAGCPSCRPTNSVKAHQWWKTGRHLWYRDARRYSHEESRQPWGCPSCSDALRLRPDPAWLPPQWYRVSSTPWIWSLHPDNTATTPALCEWVSEWVSERASEWVSE